MVLFTQLQLCEGRSASKAMQTCVPWLIAHTRSNPAGAKNQVKANTMVGLHEERQSACSLHLRPSTPPAFLPVSLPRLPAHAEPSPAPLCAASALRVMQGSTAQQHHSAGNLSASKEMLVPYPHHKVFSARTLRYTMCLLSAWSPSGVMQSIKRQTEL